MRHVLMKSVAVTILGLSAVGCKSDMSDSKGDMSMSKSDMKGDMMPVATMSDSDMMMPAPMDGMYMLVMPGQSNRPMFTTYLKKGDMLGFKSMDGKMMAIAGDKSYDATGMKGVMWVHGMAK